MKAGAGMLYPYVLAALGGYLIGCSNMALYLSKALGVDLRSAGSRNLGASNAMILLGWPAGILVGVHDIGKAVLAVLLARYFFAETALIGTVAGVACVLGHMYPFYLKFRGGKGFASYLGMVIALQWKFALVLLAAVVIVTLLTDYIVVGTVTTVISYPVFTAIRLRSWAAVAIICVATLAILYKHRENYVRIWNGTETGLMRASRGEERIRK